MKYRSVDPSFHGIIVVPGSHLQPIFCNSHLVSRKSTETRFLSNRNDYIKLNSELALLIIFLFDSQFIDGLVKLGAADVEVGGAAEVAFNFPDLILG